MIIHFKKSSLSKEAHTPELLGYELGSREALEGTQGTKRRAERMRKPIGYVLGGNSCIQDVRVWKAWVSVQPQVRLCWGKGG